MISPKFDCPPCDIVLYFNCSPLPGEDRKLQGPDDFLNHCAQLISYGAGNSCQPVQLVDQGGSLPITYDSLMFMQLHDGSKPFSDANKTGKRWFSNQPCTSGPKMLNKYLCSLFFNHMASWKPYVLISIDLFFHLLPFGPWGSSGLWMLSAHLALWRLQSHLATVMVMHIYIYIYIIIFLLWVNLFMLVSFSCATSYIQGLPKKLSLHWSLPMMMMIFGTPWWIISPGTRLLWSPNSIHCQHLGAHSANQCIDHESLGLLELLDVPLRLHPTWHQPSSGEGCLVRIWWFFNPRTAYWAFWIRSDLQVRVRNEMFGHKRKPDYWQNLETCRGPNHFYEGRNGSSSLYL